MRRLTYVFAVLTSLVFAACTTEYITEDYIEISRSSYSFRQKDSVAIVVNSNTQWTAVSSDETHFQTEQKGEDTLIVRAFPDELGMSVSGTVTFTAGAASKMLEVEILQEHFSGSFVDYPILSRGAISPSGKYAAYLEEKSYDSRKAVRYNLENGASEEMVVPQSQKMFDGVLAISDDGRTVIFEDNQNATSEVYRDGELLNLAIPEGGKNPTPQAMSADGTIFVGWYRAPERPFNRPVKWTNSGAEYELLDYPTESIAETGVGNGVMARGCSADGSVIYGSEWRAQGLLFWKDGELYNPGIDYGKLEFDENNPYKAYVSRIVLYSDVRKISPNGKYLAASYIYFDEDHYEHECPVLIDTENYEVQILKELDNTTALTVTDDGIVFGGTPTYGASQGLIIDFDAKKSIPISEWFMSNKGIVVEDNRFIYYSPDPNIYFGCKRVDNGMYPNWHLVIE